MRMADAAGDRPEGVGGWPFAGAGADADAFAEYSSVFAELGWPDGLAAGAGEVPVLDLPEAAPPAEVARPEEPAPARPGDAGASSSSSGGDGDGAARGNADRKPAAEAA